MFKPLIAVRRYSHFSRGHTNSGTWDADRSRRTAPDSSPRQPLGTCMNAEAGLCSLSTLADVVRDAEGAD